jgi:hypothetical protein
MCPPSLFPSSQNLASFLSSVTPTANPSYSVMSSRLSPAYPNLVSYPNFVLSLSSPNMATLKHPPPCSSATTLHSTAFFLVVDDFLVRYSHSSELDHLISCLSSLYDLKVHRDLPHYTYLGYTVNYSPTSPSPCTTLSMPNYIQYSAAFGGGQVLVELTLTLTNLCLPQQLPTLLFVDNECAIGLATSSVRPKKSKSIDILPKKSN